MRFQSSVLRLSISHLLLTSILCSSFFPAFAVFDNDDIDAPAVTRAVPIVIADDLKTVMGSPGFEKTVKLSFEDQKTLLPAVNQLWSKLKAEERGLMGRGSDSAYQFFSVLSQIDTSEREHVLKCALPFLRDGACDEVEVSVLLTMLRKIKSPHEREMICNSARPIWKRLDESYALLAVHCVQSVKLERLEAVTNYLFRILNGIDDLNTRLRTFGKLISVVKDLSDEEMEQVEKEYHAIMRGEKENVVENQNTAATPGASQKSGGVWSWVSSWFWKK